MRQLIDEGVNAAARRLLAATTNARALGAVVVRGHASSPAEAELIVPQPRAGGAVPGVAATARREP